MPAPGSPVRMMDSEDGTPIRVRPNELAAALVPMVLLVWGLYVAAELVWASYQLILLLMAASLVALLVSRVARLLERWTGLPPKFGSVLVLAGVSGMVLFFFFLAGSQIVAQFSQLVSDIPTTLARWERAMQGHELTRGLAEYLRSNPRSLTPEMVFGNVRGIFSSAAGFFAALAFFLATALYLSLDGRTYWRGFLTLLKTPKRKRRGHRVLSALSDNLWHFLLGQMATMTLLAVLTTLGLWLLGIPSYLALGLLAGGLAFIPVLGPALSFLPAFLVASTKGTTAIISVVGLYGAIQFLEGNFLTPIIQRKMTSVPPVLLMTTQAVMALLFGFFGVAMAAPAAVMGMVLVKELYINEDGNDCPPTERTVAVVRDETSSVVLA